MNGLVLDLRMTLRSLRKTAALFGVALLTIALGVGVNTAMFSVVNAVVLRPLPYREPDRLVSPWPEKRWGLQMFEDVRERVSSYEALSAYRQMSFMLLGDGLPESVPVAMVSPTHFGVLGVAPLAGRLFAEGDATGAAGAVVVLSHGFWQRQLGGDPSVVGRTVRLAGGGVEARTVIGILPPDFEPLPQGVDAWVPMIRTPGQPGYFGGYGMSVIARLKPGVAPAQASAELRRLVPELTPTHPTQFRPARYSPVDVVPTLELMTRGVRTQLLVLLGAVGFILLIACTNVVNLLLARAQGRRRDIAVQMALGCSPRRVARQVLMESLVLGLGGGAIGALAAVLSLPLLRNAVADYVPRAGAIEIDGRVLLFAVAVSLLTGLLFGALPALHAAGSAPGDMLRATAGRGQSQGRASGRANDLFVAAEIALSLMLLAGAGLMLKSLWQLTRVDTGFSAEGVLTMQLTLPPGRYDSLDARAALLRRIEERLGALPGVQTVGAIDFLPLSGSSNGVPYRVAGQELPPGSSQVANFRVVTPDFFRALRIPLERGRMLGPSDVPVDSGGERALLVNEAFARQHWPDRDPLGGRVLNAAGEPFGRVVGVVGDSRQMSMDAAPAPEIYGATTQLGWTGGYLVLRGDGTVPAREPVLAALRAIEPNLGVRNVDPMEEVVSSAMNDTRFYARLLTAFAGLALALGLVGVYGVMTYAASRRTREFGVRLAFGATRRDLLVAVLTRALVPVGAGLALGLAGALALTRVLASRLYEVGATDPWVLGAAALLLGAAATAAALVPAARASRLSPVRALQAE